MPALRDAASQCFNSSLVLLKDPERGPRQQANHTFQFQPGSTKSGRAGVSHLWRMETRFNSSLVLLKAYRKGASPCFVHSFNSSLVLLKGMRWGAGGHKAHCSFNSSLVLLKVCRPGLDALRARPFQFQPGSTKRAREGISSIQRRAGVSIPAWFY